MTAGDRRVVWTITGFALFWIFALALLTGCPWMDTVAVETETMAALKIRAVIAEALAEAEAKHLTPAQAEALAEAKVKKAQEELRAELAALALKAGAKGVTGDVGGAISEITGLAITAYLAYRGSKYVAKAGTAAVRRRRKIAGTPVET